MSEVIRSTVLAADDDENARFLMERAFAKARVNAKLILLKDGAEVIAYLSRETPYQDRNVFPEPSLLLLDLKMPQASGFDVMSFLKDKRTLFDGPILLLTSSDDHRDISRAYALGCFSYLVKPTDFNALVDLAQKLGNYVSSPKEEKSTLRLKADVAPLAIEPKSEIAIKPQPPKMSSTSPEMFKVLVEQVKDYAIFMLDKEGIVQSWNEGARRIKGYEASEIIGKHFSTFYLAVDLENEKPQFELRMAQEIGRYEEEGWRVRKDGSRFWANVIITPLRDPNGRLTGFAKVTRDLTQRKLQEESFQRLLESEERFRLLVEQVRDYAIFILDARGLISSWNQGARRLKGYSADEVMGKHFSIFYRPEAIAKDHPTYELNVAVREGRYEEEGWRVRKDGTQFWANVVLTSLWDKRGNLTGFAKVTRDLTERKKADDKLRAQKEELEAFAHTLTHDLRAPIRAIHSFAQVLKTELATLSESEKEAYLTRILKATNAINVLINDVLQFSQMSLSELPLEMVHLEEVIEEALSFHEAEVERVHAVIKIKKPLPTVHANRTLLLQIFSNLISNALKFPQPGQAPKVEIFSVMKNDHCHIHVRDHGVGIPQHHQENIFKMFERGNAGSESPGTGIGLAIVKRAAERLGGSVSLTSKENEGADFLVTLRCESVEAI